MSDQLPLWILTGIIGGSLFGWFLGIITLAFFRREIFAALDKSIKRVRSLFGLPL